MKTQTSATPVAHTPGPWHFKWQHHTDARGNQQKGYPKESYRITDEPSSPVRHLANVWAPAADTVYDYQKGFAIAEANARLIAAAPELLATLRDILRDHDACVADEQPGFLTSYQEAVARAAITKATA